MVFPDASMRAEKRTSVIKQLMQRLRRVLAQGSPVYAEVKLAYMDKRGGLVKLREIIRSMARSVAGGSDFVYAAQQTTKRTKLVEQLVSMLENAGFDEVNRFQGGATPSMAPSMPMGRADPSVVAQSNLAQLASIDPPFPYDAAYPDNSLIQMAPKVEYTYRLGIVTPSLVQGRVICPREPQVYTIDHINIVNGIKHVKGFYEGNVIHVRLPNHKFKDSAEKCQYFSILREAFDEYRRQFEEHKSATDPWWQRHVMTDWTVYLDEGNDNFDSKPEAVDNRKVFDNDMSIDVDVGGGRITVGKPVRETIPICVTRFDGRNNVGHTRSETMNFYPGGDGIKGGQGQFSVRNLLRFMWKTDDYYVYYQDWYPAHVRRIIISGGDDNAEADNRANERVINFLKQDARNAVFVVNRFVEDMQSKEITRVIRCVNEFTLAGREGYDRLAVVIVDDNAFGNLKIESRIMTSRATYIGLQNPAYVYMTDTNYRKTFTYNNNPRTPSDYVFQEVNSVKFEQDGTGVPKDFKLAFSSTSNDQTIFAPLYNLVRFSPQQGFYQLVQKHDVGQQMMFSDNDKRNIFIEQVATNHPIFIDEQVLQGFTTPDHGRYSSQGADSDLFVAKVDNFSLVGQTGGQKIFVHPNKLPAEYYNFLRQTQLFPCVILGVQDDKKSGQCVDDSVEQFCQKNRIPVDLLPYSKFNNVLPNEYVFVRTQLHKSTNTVILYQYKFDPTYPGELKTVQKLYNATDLEDTGLGNWANAQQEYM